MGLLREKAERGAKIKTLRVCQSEEQRDRATQREREREQLPVGFTLPDHSLESQQITVGGKVTCKLACAGVSYYHTLSAFQTICKTKTKTNLPTKRKPYEYNSVGGQNGSKSAG